jgi:hypothetical protein
MDLLMGRKMMEGVLKIWYAAGVESVPEPLRMPMVLALMELERLETESAPDYVCDPAKVAPIIETLTILRESAPVLGTQIGLTLERLVA